LKKTNRAAGGMGNFLLTAMCRLLRNEPAPSKGGFEIEGRGLPPKGDVGDGKAAGKSAGGKLHPKEKGLDFVKG